MFSLGRALVLLGNGMGWPFGVGVRADLRAKRGPWHEATAPQGGAGGYGRSARTTKWERVAAPLAGLTGPLRKGWPPMRNVQRNASRP
jgi:hypothetical protein